MPGSATYTVEAELDAFDGLGGWRTTELTEADLKREGLLPLEASTLQAEFRGPLAFLEGLKVLGAPRYTMRTALDPSAKPHVIAVVLQAATGAVKLGPAWLIHTPLILEI